MAFPIVIFTLPYAHHVAGTDQVTCEMLKSRTIFSSEDGYWFHEYNVA
jgi:hypothetical protein